MRPAIETPPQTKTDDTVIYDPTQEIVDRLDRIARTLEEQTLMAREEYRSKGFVLPKKE